MQRRRRYEGVNRVKLYRLPHPWVLYQRLTLEISPPYLIHHPQLVIVSTQIEPCFSARGHRDGGSGCHPLEDNKCPTGACMRTDESKRKITFPASICVPFS